MTRSLFLLFLLPFVFQANAQDSRFPKDYYTFPIKPNQQNYLSAKMGELRSNHFYAGLDVKTDGREGLNMYSVADGYVYRVKISSYGYGLALYIVHPNGRKVCMRICRNSMIKLPSMFWSNNSLYRSQTNFHVNKQKTHIFRTIVWVIKKILGLFMILCGLRCIHGRMAVFHLKKQGQTT